MINNELWTIEKVKPAFLNPLIFSQRIIHTKLKESNRLIQSTLTFLYLCFKKQFYFKRLASLKVEETPAIYSLNAT